MTGGDWWPHEIDGRTGSWRGACRSFRGGTLLALAISAIAVRAEAVTAIIDAGRRSDPVTQYEYGMFIEPIGGLIARSLWAEMLDDRKFYYAIVPEREDPPPPRASRAAQESPTASGGRLATTARSRWMATIRTSARIAPLLRRKGIRRAVLDRVGSGLPRVGSTAAISS